LYRGQLAEGLEQMDRAISADEMEGFKEWGYLMKVAAKSNVYTELEDFDQAMVECDRAIEIMASFLPSDVPYFRYQAQIGHAAFMARNKRLSDAKKIVDELAPAISQAPNKELLRDFYVTKGAIALEEGDIGAAGEHLEKAEDINSSFEGRYLLAQTYLRGDRLPEAIDLYEKIIKEHTSSRIAFPTWSVKVHYYLAVAYDKLGEHEKAKEQYERFVSIWQNGDPNIQEVSAAKARLEALEAGS
jgi:tetratricopeptide (TPR) repeat protein